MANQTPLVILGSNRPGSDTQAFVEYVFEGRNYNMIDLLTHEIAPYRYDGIYPPTDNFLQFVDTVLQHEIIVFATPVYWYSMSGLMKTMFDRLTDLIRIHKPLGRRFKNKHLFLLSVGANEDFPEGFKVPFVSSADYLDMHYQGSVYYSTGEEVSDEEKNKRRQDFISSIQKVQTEIASALTS